MSGPARLVPLLFVLSLSPGIAVLGQQEPDPPTSDEGDGKRPPDQILPRIDLDLKAHRITLNGAIAIPRGLIELFACTSYGKTHEAVCIIDVDPQHLKAGLLLLGLKDSPQVTRLGERKALKGDRVILYVEWEKDGERQRHRAEELIWDRTTDSPMKKVGWVFTGSRFLKVPVYLPDKEKPEEREVFMASETGNIVSTYHDPDSLLDNPLEKGGDDTIYYANDRLLPPRGTPIKLIIELPAEEKGPNTGAEVEEPTGKRTGAEKEGAGPPAEKGKSGKDRKE